MIDPVNMTHKELVAYIANLKRMIHTLQEQIRKLTTP